MTDHSVACPSALIGASNFFELAVATAISLFSHRLNRRLGNDFRYNSGLTRV